MPSAADFQRADTALAVTSSYVMLVSESIGNLAVAVAADTCQTLTAATYVLQFKVESVAGTRTLACAYITSAAQAGSLPLYFLPWCQNAATTMTLPAGAVGPGVFMTSMLSGCTVQVHGTAANPTITHANARAKYEAAYGQQEKVLTSFLGKGVTPQQTHDFSEARANSVATGAINSMLPAVVGNSGTARKSDYAGRLNQANLLAAQRRVISSLPANEALGSYDVGKMKLKPKTGAFVWGVRDATHNWSFYCQAAVEVEFMVQDKFGGRADQNFTMESAVLGTPNRFFP
jgi:hypothetical protein